MERKHAVSLALLALLLVVGRAAAAVEQQPTQQDATVKQVKEIASQVWEMVSPWVQKGANAGREVFSIVCQKASFQGLKSVASEASRISFNFFTGKPYQAAYQVAKDVPLVGSAVKDVVGEANLRKKAAREHAEAKNEL